MQLVTAKDKEDKAQRLKEASKKAVVQHEQHSQTTPSLQQQPHHMASSTVPATQMIAAMVGKGRRKQSNPMKRPRENGKMTSVNVHTYIELFSKGPGESLRNELSNL